MSVIAGLGSPLGHKLMKDTRSIGKCMRAELLSVQQRGKGTSLYYMSRSRFAKVLGLNAGHDGMISHSHLKVLQCLGVSVVWQCHY